MELREYEPAGLVHATTCPGAPRGLVRLQATSLRASHDRPHICINGAWARANRDVVIERIDYEPHDYEPSTILPSDATRELCRTCRGTHGDELVAGPMDPLERIGLERP